MTPAVAVSRITAADTKAEATHRLVETVELGRNRNGDLGPILLNGTPLCHHCEMGYPVDRLTAGVENPHVCCGCATLYEGTMKKLGRTKPRGFHGHPAHSFSGRDDHRSGKRTLD